MVFRSNKSKYGKIILVHVYIIFALPDYSDEVIERLQNLFYVSRSSKKDYKKEALLPHRLHDNQPPANDLIS